MADAPFLAIGRPPLRARSEGIELRGFLRHRSFLADFARGGTRSYRRLLAASLRQGMTVIDGGAHIGVYTLIAARGVGPTGRVIAFEPDPYNRAALEANVRRAAATNVEIAAEGLADAPGRATFHQSLGTISSSIAERTDRGPSRTIDVELTSIDSELPRAPSSLLVKLNVEGAEPLVLSGMRRTLAECGEIVLFVEMNPEALRAAGSGPAELVAELEGYGFEVHGIDPVDESLRPLPPPAQISKGHLYCRKGGGDESSTAILELDGDPVVDASEDPGAERK
jgi:FkbM family methyltransferase